MESPSYITDALCELDCSFSVVVVQLWSSSNRSRSSEFSRWASWPQLVPPPPPPPPPPISDVLGVSPSAHRRWWFIGRAPNANTLAVSSPGKHFDNPNPSCLLSPSLLSHSLLLQRRSPSSPQCSLLWLSATAWQLGTKICRSHCNISASLTHCHIRQNNPPLRCVCLCLLQGKPLSRSSVLTLCDHLLHWTTSSTLSNTAQHFFRRYRCLIDTIDQNTPLILCSTWSPRTSALTLLVSISRMNTSFQT